MYERARNVYLFTSLVLTLFLYLFPLYSAATFSALFAPGIPTADGIKLLTLILIAGSVGLYIQSDRTLEWKRSTIAKTGIITVILFILTLGVGAQHALSMLRNILYTGFLIATTIGVCTFAHIMASRDTEIQNDVFSGVAIINTALIVLHLFFKYYMFG